MKISLSKVFLGRYVKYLVKHNKNKKINFFSNNNNTFRLLDNFKYINGVKYKSNISKTLRYLIAPLYT